MRNKRRRIVLKIVQQAVCITLSLAILAPIYMVLINSFKTKSEAARMSLSLPTEWMFENYLEVIEKGRLVQGFFNSLAYSGISTGIGVILCAMAAFVLARHRTRLNNFIYYFVLCGLFFPVNYVTLVRLFRTLELTDTRVGIIITFLSSMVPFCVFTMRNFVLSIPVSLDEAAIIDGAGPINLFFRVALPLLKPSIVTAFILQFMGVWSDFLTPLYLSSKSKLFPMTMAVYQFFGRNNSNWNYVFADIILTLIPVISVYMLGQRYIVSGMTSGAVKQ